MKRLVTYGLGAAVVLAFASTVFAQTKSITHETKVVTATIEAIQHSTRTITIKQSDGTYEDVYVPSEIKRFDQLKVGDTVTARYYENIVLRLQQPGEKPVDKSEEAVTPTKDKVAGTVAHQRTITATITAIDPKLPSITFTGPHGWKYSTKVKDTAALAKVKVGDKLDITWTEAAMVSIETPKDTAK